MRTLAPFLLLVFFSVSAPGFSGKGSPEARELNALFEKMFVEKLEQDPQFRTYIGEKIDYDKLTDVSEAARKRALERAKRNLATLEAFPEGGLDEDSRISLEIARALARQEIEAFAFRHHVYPVQQMFGEHAELPSFMINQHGVESEADARAYIARLTQFDRKLGQVIENMRLAEKRGIVPPKFALAHVHRDIKNITSGQPFTATGEDSPLWEDFRSKVAKVKGLDDATRKELLSSAQKALKEDVATGYAKLTQYLKGLEKKAPALGTATTLPDGRKYYELMLRHHTTTNLSAQQIHEIGLKEVARIHGEMREVMARIDPSHKDLKRFFAHLKTSPSQKFPSTEAGRQAYLESARKHISHMEEQLPKLFTLLPKADIKVKAVEPYREKSAGLAFYEGPSEDGKRPGTYYVNLYDMDSVVKYEVEALAYHEAIPGHHMQVAIATELEGLPRFRKYHWVTSFGEGWALYAELIPKEIGMYQDPYSDFGRLTMDLWRACRLVVDTGLHAKGWSKKKAIDYLKTNTPTSDLEALKSVERYIVMPGQATAYTVGKLKILELRNYAKTQLGPHFDIRRFHDVVLRGGTVPLNVLETTVKAWVQEEKGART